MKIKYCGVFVFLLLFSSCAKNAEELKAISYNIRYDNQNDGDNKWDNRKVELVDFLKSEEADVIGLQESLKHQLEYILEGILDYEFIGVGREDGKEKGEYAPIVYNSNKLELIGNGHFWLSSTPEIVSTGWDAALPRICTYGHFISKGSAKEFLIFNAHFDHMGAEARVKSAELILNKIKALNSKALPVVLMGDFNAKPTDLPIVTFDNSLDDGLKVSKRPFTGQLGTFNGFKKKELYDRIDYIFSKDFLVLEYRHAPNKRTNSLQLSDHVPIISVLEFE